MKTLCWARFFVQQTYISAQVYVQLVSKKSLSRFTTRLDFHRVWVSTIQTFPPSSIMAGTDPKLSPTLTKPIDNSVAAAWESDKTFEDGYKVGFDVGFWSCKEDMLVEEQKRAEEQKLAKDKKRDKKRDKKLVKKRAKKTMDTDDEMDMDDEVKQFDTADAFLVLENFDVRIDRLQIDVDRIQGDIDALATANDKLNETKSLLLSAELRIKELEASDLILQSKLLDLCNNI